jgi:RecB family exonuclease
MVEVPFELAVPPLRLRGRIDAIYEHGPGNWEIVDFKSGRRSVDEASAVQLEAYAVAASGGALGPSRPDRMTVTFAFLSGVLDEVSASVDQAWLDRAGSHLQELVAGIADERFEPRPSAVCQSCDFLMFCDAGKAAVR